MKVILNKCLERGKKSNLESDSRVNAPLDNGKIRIKLANF
jgi:hypothetical protein